MYLEVHIHALNIVILVVYLFVDYSVEKHTCFERSN